MKEAIRRSSTYFLEEPTEDTVSRIYDKINKEINGNRIKFVLRVDIDTSRLNSNSYLVLEDSRYAFDIYCYDSKFNPTFFVYFNKDELDNFGNVYQTPELKYAKKLKAAVKQILKKKPKHILFSYHLPNTILYVNNDRIYVYRVIQKEVYELDHYVAKFKDSDFFYQTL
ncbi:hypothetical protein [Sphingobacterium chuzhouense]|uniref:Uncharacterized protein n=1 Tax=Sphingobacterium chuzhouense TaxID=1742264 RepID=A0ABR7XP96_9SPHI|nr:hypothetical protein [Sphingobacterium chuzhouense]MBD1420995.1 hypothetical protein [Sphingobacterium chuzhouense]